MLGDPSPEKFRQHVGSREVLATMCIFAGACEYLCLCVLHVRAQQNHKKLFGRFPDRSSKDVTCLHSSESFRWLASFEGSLIRALRRGNIVQGRSELAGLHAAGGLSFGSGASKADPRRVQNAGGPVSCLCRYSKGPCNMTPNLGKCPFQEQSPQKSRSTSAGQERVTSN